MDAGDSKEEVTESDGVLKTNVSCEERVAEQELSPRQPER